MRVHVVSDVHGSVEAPLRHPQQREDEDEPEDEADDEAEVRGGPQRVDDGRAEHGLHAEDLTGDLPVHRHGLLRVVPVVLDDDLDRSAADAAGLVLLVMTLLMNGLAIYIRYRIRKGIR